jgi:hypothetical protein
MIQIPYLHWTRESDYQEQVRTANKLAAVRQSEEDRIRILEEHRRLKLRSFTPLGEYIHHPRRTLDRYNFCSTDATERHKDQIIGKYIKKAYPSNTKLLMVDQLWMWATSKGE